MSEIYYMIPALALPVSAILIVSLLAYYLK